MDNRPQAKRCVNRGPREVDEEGKVVEKTYVLGPLTQSQIEQGNVIALELNTHIRNELAPGCSYIYADMSAPDLFNWFNAEIMNFEGVDN